MVLVGTKLDLTNEREVSRSHLEELSARWKIPVYETSAKRNWDVSQAFEDLVRQMRQYYPVEEHSKRKGRRSHHGRIHGRNPCIIMWGDQTSSAQNHSFLVVLLLTCISYLDWLSSWIWIYYIYTQNHFLPRLFIVFHHNYVRSLGFLSCSVPGYLKIIRYRFSHKQAQLGKYL